MFKFILRSKLIIGYAVLLAALVLVLKWLEWKYLMVDNSMEAYIGLLAIFFTVLGVWIARHIVKPKVETVVVEKEVIVTQNGPFIRDEAALEKLNLSAREYEILQLLAKGYSNAEIAGGLFLSLSTVKTHISNLFFKLDVKSRTKAIEKSKRLRIIE